MSRVLVTGAAGRIGSVVVEHLLARGYAVTALVLQEPDGPLPADRVVVGDVRDPDVVADAMLGADAVVHLAALPNPHAGTAFEVYTSNTTGTWAVLTTAAEQGVGRVVLASSINAYGVQMNPHDVLPAYYPIDEDVPHDVGDPYSLSKQADEAAAACAWRAWGTTTICLRFPFTATHERIVEAARGAAADPASKVRAGWSYLDVRDAARAVRAALEAPVEGAHVLQLAASDTLLSTPSAELLARYAPGVPLRREVAGNRSLVDTTRAETLLGFRPRWSVHDEAGGSPS